MADARIGISGWNYPPWRGVFYPRGLVQKRELEFASTTFRSIEVNGSFYSLLRPSTVRKWYERTPDDFVFALKGSRFITHMKRLRDVDAALANFFASGVLAFEDKLGPILWQLPPQLTYDAARLSEFFARLPRSTQEAAQLAKKHDARVAGRAVTTTERDRPLRHALEVRHPTYGVPAFFDLLRREKIALCVADTARLFPDWEDVTADFVYVRLHGDTKLYESGHSKKSLTRWAEKVTAWQSGAPLPGAKLADPQGTPPPRPRDVYVYFDNDAKVRAPFDALTLEALVSGGPARRAPKGIARAGEPAREVWPAWK